MSDVFSPAVLSSLSAVGGSLLTVIAQRILPSADKKLDAIHKTREQDTEAEVQFRDQLMLQIGALTARLERVEKELDVERKQNAQQQVISMYLYTFCIKNGIVPDLPLSAITQNENFLDMFEAKNEQKTTGV